MTHCLLQAIIDDVVALKDGETTDYSTVIGNGKLTISASLTGNYLKLTLSDGISTESAGTAVAGSAVDAIAAMRDAMARLLIGGKANVLGVTIRVSGDILVAQCGTYSSGRVHASVGDKVALRRLAVDIIEYIP